MKQFFSTLILIFSIVAAFGQITLQKTHNYSTSVVKLETIGYKYFLMDVPASQCRIYNMDHSLYKTINCPVPSGYYLSDVKYLSERLFNSDSQIELICTYYKYVSSGNSYYYIYGSKVVGETGNTILTIDGAQYVYPIQTGTSEYKLFAYCYDYSVSPEKVWTNIYSLPGIPVYSANITDKQPEVLMKAWPNPANEIIRLEYQLPDQVNSARLNVFDATGRLVRNFEIDSHSDHIAMDVSDLTSGTYLYNIEYNHQQSVSKKIVVR